MRKWAVLYHVYNLKNGLWKHKLKVNMDGSHILINKIKVRNKGNNNQLYIGENARMWGCTFHIHGNNNVIYIGSGCSLRDTHFYIEDDNNEIRLNGGVTTTGQVEISAIEGTKVIIGEDCMISSNIYIATGDGHSVCSQDGKRTNFSKDILIGSHVWIGTRVIIGKGFKIGDNSIVAAGSVLASLCEEKNNVIIGGNPAKIVKDNVGWKRDRV